MTKKAWIVFPRVIRYFQIQHDMGININLFFLNDEIFCCSAIAFKFYVFIFELSLRDYCNFKPQL